MKLIRVFCNSTRLIFDYHGPMKNRSYNKKSLLLHHFVAGSKKTDHEGYKSMTAVDVFGEVLFFGV